MRPQAAQPRHTTLPSLRNRNRTICFPHSILCSVATASKTKFFIIGKLKYLSGSLQSFPNEGRCHPERNAARHAIEGPPNACIDGDMFQDQAFRKLRKEAASLTSLRSTRLSASESLPIPPPTSLPPNPARKIELRGTNRNIPPPFASAGLRNPMLPQYAPRACDSNAAICRIAATSAHP